MAATKTVIIGKSPLVSAMIKLVERVAPAKTSVLIIGESGTGKELVARMIHELSPMRDKAFVPVNCGAIPENLIESELFGHKRGSFTGAVADKPGLFEVADGGTLFLDEIGELPLGLQVKLLRALQDRTIRRVGGNEDIKVDVRLITATNRDLEAAAQKGTFREDLYYRLNVIQIRTPPLRERSGDVMILAEAFLKRFADKNNKTLTGFETDAAETMQRYPWPGNVRELENSIERACILENRTKVTLDSLPPTVRDSAGVKSNATSVSSGKKAEPSANDLRLPSPNFAKGPINLDEILGEVEKTYIKRALEHASGVKKTAADLLGITFRSFRYRLKKLGMESGGADDED